MQIRSYDYSLNRSALVGVNFDHIHEHLKVHRHRIEWKGHGKANGPLLDDWSCGRLARELQALKEVK